MLTGKPERVPSWTGIVQYRIKDPSKYCFKVRSVEQTLRDMSEPHAGRVVAIHSVVRGADDRARGDLPTTR